MVRERMCVPIAPHWNRPGKRLIYDVQTYKQTRALISVKATTHDFGVRVFPGGSGCRVEVLRQCSITLEPTCGVQAYKQRNKGAYQCKGQVWGVRGVQTHGVQGQGGNLHIAHRNSDRNRPMVYRPVNRQGPTLVSVKAKVRRLRSDCVRIDCASLYLAVT